MKTKLTWSLETSSMAILSTYFSVVMFLHLHDYYKALLHHVKILMWISHAPSFYTVGTSYLYMEFLSIHIHDLPWGSTAS
jgi:hypothetical protein